MALSCLFAGAGAGAGAGAACLSLSCCVRPEYFRRGGIYGKASMTDASCRGRIVFRNEFTGLPSPPDWESVRHASQGSGRYRRAKSCQKERRAGTSGLGFATTGRVLDLILSFVSPSWKQRLPLFGAPRAEKDGRFWLFGLGWRAANRVSRKGFFHVAKGSEDIDWRGIGPARSRSARQCWRGGCCEVGPGESGAHGSQDRPHDE